VTILVVPKEEVSIMFRSNFDMSVERQKRSTIRFDLEHTQHASSEGGPEVGLEGNE
jgi:hypothetical protein